MPNPTTTHRLRLEDDDGPGLLVGELESVAMGAIFTDCRCHWYRRESKQENNESKVTIVIELQKVIHPSPHKAGRSLHPAKIVSLLVTVVYPRRLSPASSWLSLAARNGLPYLDSSEREFHLAFKSKLASSDKRCLHYRVLPWPPSSARQTTLPPEIALRSSVPAFLHLWPKSPAPLGTTRFWHSVAQTLAGNHVAQLTHAPPRLLIYRSRDQGRYRESGTSSGVCYRLNATRDSVSRKCRPQRALQTLHSSRSTHFDCRHTWSRRLPDG